MIDQTFADAFKLEADFLAESNERIAGLARYAGQTATPRVSPLLAAVVVSDRAYRNRAGYVRVNLTVESDASDDGPATDPGTHRARVQLVHDIFVTDRAARIASINGREVVRISDYGPLPAKSEVIQDPAGPRLRTTLILLLAGHVL